MIIGAVYSCEESAGYSLPGVALCFAVNAVEIAICVIKCGAGALNCFKVLYGFGDPATCTDDYPGCMACLDNLGIDCGCLAHVCYTDTHTDVYGDADTIYGGGCP